MSALLSFGPWAVSIILTGQIHATPDPPVVVVPECSEHVAGADSDGDGLSDSCEFALATAVAPVLAARAGGCNWDASFDPPRLGGGYFHAVGPSGTRVRVAYLPAYLYDCGWHDFRCVVPFIDCSPHAGDSEFVVIELEPGPDDHSWVVTGIFLSAHCFGRRASSCRWYRGPDLPRFRWHGTSPIIWVAEGRNANYATWQDCNGGHRTMDTCARHDVYFRYPVSTDRNIGSRANPTRPGGCYPGSEISGAVHAERVECFWLDNASFRGWQQSDRGVTSYERYLRELAGF